MADHGHQRDDAGAACNEQHGWFVTRLPDEVAADRPAYLEGVSLPQLVDEVGRYFTVLQALDSDREVVLGSRGDRVAALRLVAVLGRQPHVEVLARTPAGPL